MSGPKRNPDKLNTIGIVVVGICGAVLVYVTIIALQAFYVDDTAEVQTMADYGGQDSTAKGHKAAEMQNITETASNPAAANQTYRIPIDRAMKLVVEDVKRDPSHLVPALPPSIKPTIEPIFGRPKTLGASAAGSGSASSGSAAPTPAEGSGSAGSAGSGSAGSAAEPPPTPATPTPKAAPTTSPKAAPKAAPKAGGNGH